MAHRFTFLLVLTFLLPVFVFMTSCEKLRKEIQTEMERGQREKVSVSTCCWCIDANTNANLISSYISPKHCEDAVNDPTKAVTNCRQVKVDSERCSFQRITEKPLDRPGRNLDWREKFREARTTTDLKIHGSDEYITAVTPQPTHCSREISSTGEPASTDPRCSPETCKCFADETLPWNCELVVIRKDGKKESFGQRPKLDREQACDATSCRALFPREVRAFCPSFN